VIKNFAMACNQTYQALHQQITLFRQCGTLVRDCQIRLREAKSVGLLLQQVLSDDAEAEFFRMMKLKKVLAGVFTLTKEYVLGSKLTGLHP